MTIFPRASSFAMDGAGRMVAAATCGIKAGRDDDEGCARGPSSVEREGPHRRVRCADARSASRNAIDCGFLMLTISRHLALHRQPIEYVPQSQLYSVRVYQQIRIWCSRAAKAAVLPRIVSNAAAGNRKAAARKPLGLVFQAVCLVPAVMPDAAAPAEGGIRRR